MENFLLSWGRLTEGVWKSWHPQMLVLLSSSWCPWWSPSRTAKGMICTCTSRLIVDHWREVMMQRLTHSLLWPQIWVSNFRQREEQRCLWSCNCLSTSISCLYESLGRAAVKPTAPSSRSILSTSSLDKTELIIFAGTDRYIPFCLLLPT